MDRRANIINLMNEESKSLTENKPLENFRKSIINVDEEIIKPPNAFLLKNKSFGTLGNISLIKGKAKSRKSMLLSIFCAGILGGLNKYIQSCLVGQTIIYFDTEQSDYHAQLQNKRIFTLLGHNSKNLIYSALREYTPTERLEVIEQALIYKKNIGYVFIDGITDLMTKGVNDEAEAIEVTTKLLRWSKQYNIHITCVLHQNKGDSHAKGHLGSYLVQKSETVISVDRLEHDKTISRVSASEMRGGEIEDIHFSVNDNGIPVIEDNEIVSTPQSNKPKKDPFDYEIAIHKELLKEIFKGSSELKRRDLMDKIMHYSKKHLGVSIADNKSRQWVNYYYEEGFIAQEKKLKPFKLVSEMG